ncbi:HAD hydrolase-like protein [Puniceicoccaceae bacterium K14]|nr:HAD hydrolase-like protein [Puniceicoccaceae bacterium K14]
MIPETLVLWDIDRTLVWNGGAGERALVTAAEEICNEKLDLSKIPYSGRTDRWIAKAIIEFFGQEADQEKQIAFQNSYLDNLEKEMPNSNAYILGGVKEVLDTLAQDEKICQALLTGNLVRGAKLKLDQLGLWSYFDFGGFADASPNRNDLSAHALALAEERFNKKFDLERVFVIGDTPYDIECGKVIGAQAIAVATGCHSMEVLAEHKPHFLLESLQDTKRFLKIVS